MSKKNPQSSPKKIENAVRDKEILALRAKHVPTNEIADNFGMTTQRVLQICKSQIDKLPQEGAKELRYIVNTQLDMLLGSVWQQALNGDLKAHQQALATIDRKCKLNGLYVSSEDSQAGNKSNIQINVNMTNQTKNPNVEIDNKYF